MAARFRWWWGASLLAHASLLGVVAGAAPPQAPVAAPPRVVDVDLSPSGPGADDARRAEGIAHAAPTSAPNPRPGGERSAQNLSAARRGEGGDGRSEAAARVMASRADAVDLDDRLANAVGATQEQRIRTARDRRSPQDDRRTPNPGDDPWVSTGHGVLLLRVPRANAIPREGLRTSAGAAELQGAPSTLGDRPAEGGSDARGGSDTLGGGARTRVGAGVVGSHGSVARVAGPVATQRALIEQGHASTTADRASERTADDADSAMLAATLLRNHVSASTQDGPTRGAGSGGVGGGGDPGSGGEVGRGGRTAPHGSGDGWLSLSTDDPRYRRYFAEVRRALHALWRDAFPRDEALRGNFGTVILGFVIERDGAVRAVEVRRRSGVDRFDANVRGAVAHARLPPIPAEIGEERLRVRAPFEFRNPVVR
ncbi:MAG: TonB family protein [Polyangiales bacterium]